MSRAVEMTAILVCLAFVAILSGILSTFVFIGTKVEEVLRG